MSSSSAAEPHKAAPILDAEGELEEAEALEHDAKERKLGPEPEARGARTSGWSTFFWALPGGLWLGFYLVAPLVFIVLVSFWTYELGAKSGFTTDWTLSNYDEIFHSSTYCSLPRPTGPTMLGKTLAST